MPTPIDPGSETAVHAAARGPLSVREQLTGARLLVVGGTGFLGKVWLSMLLAWYPEVEHVYLMVRPKADRTSEERFWAEVASSAVFDPLRELHPGPAYEAYLKQKVTPVPGDVSMELGGLPDAVRDSLRGKLTALVNAAGVVDFTPPLDDALNVNAFGMQKLVALAEDLGSPPFMHTSTCFVAGGRTGQVDEVDPRAFPFPRMGELDPKHWDPENEIAECVDVVEHVLHRAKDAFRQSEFLDRAKANLRKKGEPARGTALEDELKKVRRRYEADELVAAGLERAKFWGWPNTYTYTKSIGEQILAASGLPFTIVRPAVIESSLSFPKPGWNEGITTSAPLTYLSVQGMYNLPVGDHSVLDIIPADTVAVGMLLSLAELIEGTAPPVYQYGTSDLNPLPCERLYELTGLYKRRHWRDSGKNPLVSWVQSQFGTSPISLSQYERWGARPVADKTKALSGLLKKVGRDLRVLKPVLKPATAALDAVSVTHDRIAWITEQYIPFIAIHSYFFSCRNTRAAHARLSAEEKARLDWSPEAIDWRHYLLDVHLPGLEELVWPLIEDKVKRPKLPLRKHDSLLSILDEGASRYQHMPALMVRHEDGLARVSYLQLKQRVEATAARLLATGIAPGDRVLLSGRNHPDWVVGWFGVIRAGAVVVPIDPALDPEAAARIAEFAKVRAALFDAEATEDLGDAVGRPVYDLAAATAPGKAPDLPAVSPAPDDTASILFTSGTTGAPKGVMLTHGNFASLLASLARVFRLTPDDRVLSVLPLHHTFEFTCGLLLPLACGARVLYLDEVSGPALLAGLEDGRITGMVGVPALWELLERRIKSQAKEKGDLFATAFDLGLELNRIVGRSTGLDLGRALFGTVHGRLGGNIRLLISGGAALPQSTHQFFQGLGLPIAEGYGLTEAAPVLAVAPAKAGAKGGTVGTAIPGVELRIKDPDDKGVGEVIARGPNVMVGYFQDRDATAAVLDDDGWLHTGDLGRLDGRGRLTIVGRAKDVVVTASGENVYLDDVEERLSPIEGVKELSLVGIDDGKGGELLAMLAVPELPDDSERRAAHAAAHAAIRAAVAELQPAMRPSVVHLVDADLPRTATRKVKRKEVRRILERIVAASAPVVQGEDLSGPVRRAIAMVAGVEEKKVTAGTRLGEDLRFDSLMWVELAAALDALPEGGPSVEALSGCATVAEVERLADAPPAPIEAGPVDERAPLRIPEPLVGPLKRLLTAVQREAYDSLLDVDVRGRAFIPQNRSAIVVSNHSSHLDMGLVKYALGEYGREMVGLAAKDYFFEGHPIWVAYFEQLTQLAPIDRAAGFRASFRQAKDIVERGHVVLLFPEGTRRTDGLLGEFKPLVGKLSLETGVDILPLYLDGPYEVLPKGAMLPKGRKLKVRIGPPLQSADLERLTEGMRPARAARTVAGLARRAVAALREGEVLDLRALQSVDAEDEGPPKDPIEALMSSLPARLRTEEVDGPLSWYWKLGDGDEQKWTVSVAPDAGVTVRRGKPVTGQADCVVRTAPGMVLKILGEAYAPSVPEFMDGTIKTSDIPLLMRFAQVFRLGPDGERADDADGLEASP